MSGGVFQRHEIKFLLDSRQRGILERAMRGHMRADEYGESSICSLYYDTPDHRLIRRSLEKPDYKEKLRLRSYGTAKRDDMIFVELKKKYNGVVYKRRVSMKEREATAYLAGRAPLPEDSQIGREIDWFRKYYGGLIPAMYLSYDRVAYFCPEDDDLRVTLDRNIRWRTDELTLTKAPGGEALLRPDQSLLEIKTAAAMPLWLVKALGEGQMRKTSFSKYGTAYTITQTRNDNREEKRYA